MRRHRRLCASVSDIIFQIRRITCKDRPKMGIMPVNPLDPLARCGAVPCRQAGNMGGRQAVRAQIGPRQHGLRNRPAVAPGRQKADLRVMGADRVDQREVHLRPKGFAFAHTAQLGQGGEILKQVGWITACKITLVE